LKDKQEHEEKLTATPCPFLNLTSEEGLRHHCLQIFSPHQLAHGQVQSGCWQPIQHSDATDADNNTATLITM